jgi:hypothetical protein
MSKIINEGRFLLNYIQHITTLEHRKSNRYSVLSPPKRTLDGLASFLATRLSQQYNGQDAAIEAVQAFAACCETTLSKKTFERMRDTVITTTMVVLDACMANAEAFYASGDEEAQQAQLDMAVDKENAIKRAADERLAALEKQRLELVERSSERRQFATLAEHVLEEKARKL